MAYASGMDNDAALDKDPLTPAGPGFTAGLITGGFIGALLALAFAPRAGVDLRRRVIGVARDLGAAAAAQAQQPETVASPVTR